MLDLGIATSHAPAMFEPRERWSVVYDRRPDYTKNSQPASALLETPEVIDGYLRRIEVGFSTLRAQVEAYRPDVLLVVGDDQGDMYNETCNPAFALFTGEAFWGLDKTWYSPRDERRRRFSHADDDLAWCVASSQVLERLGELVQPAPNALAS